MDTNVDIPAEERRTLKLGMTASRLEMDPPLSTPIGQTSSRGNNHIPDGDTTKEVPLTSSKVPSDGILEESFSQMTTILSNIIEHHGRKNQCLVSLEEDLAHAKLEEEKLKAMIEALEKETSKMNAKVALMERKDLYDLLEAKMEGFQIANHPGTTGADIVNNNDERRFALSDVNKALNMWRANNVIVGVSFVRGHRTLQDEVDRTGIDVRYQSLLDALKVAVGTLPNSLAIFEYMRSIFDSYVNPNNNPNVQPIVKGLDVDDFSVDKFFGLQDPTSPDDVQANPSSPPPSQIVPVPTLVDLTQYASSPENEGSEDQGWPLKNDLTKAGLESTMYKGRYLQGDVINMYINEAFLKKPHEQLQNMFYVNTFWFTKANELVARYDNTNHAEEAMIKITRLRKSICPELHDEDMQGNLPMWIFVPIHDKNHWSLAIIRLHNDDAWLAYLDTSRGTHDLEAIFHVLKQVLCLIVPIDPALVMTGIMNVEQQQDGHSCEKHVLQMLAGVAKKELDGLDRCFREEGLRYIATLDQVRSFDMVFGMYLSHKLVGPPM
ncbi:hypothetical protein R1flu_024394 [Riccia fluitans]|uniref:Ubiquitin-like protease family profile domain-containing protein n=1 Tax=Riccia fluitans TaxID=41844 RepID=A0ABD1XUX3_9MARC